MFSKIALTGTVAFALIAMLPLAPAPVSFVTPAAAQMYHNPEGGAYGQDARFGRGEVYWRGPRHIGGCRGPTCGGHGNGGGNGHMNGRSGGGGVQMYGYHIRTTVQTCHRTIRRNGVVVYDGPCF